jgi:hypothetical protein
MFADILVTSSVPECQMHLSIHLMEAASSPLASVHWKTTRSSEDLAICDITSFAWGIVKISEELKRLGMPKQSAPQVSHLVARSRIVLIKTAEDDFD